MTDNLQIAIDQAWGKELSAQEQQDLLPILKQIIDLLDAGKIRVSEPQGNHQWYTHQWIKKAILLFFKLTPARLMTGGTEDEGHGTETWYDKIPLKCANWTSEDFKRAGFRAVPGSVARKSAYIGPQVVLMPSFVNAGAYVDQGTMVDTWCTIGSCAQIGKNCHISGGVGIGGVLEPVQANPVIIEDNCFIGARSEIAEGVIVEEGCVISMGVFISASTKIVDRATGNIVYGRVPAYSVVVPGSLPPVGASGPHLASAVIIKTVDEKTRAKTAINELLRS